MRANHHSNLAAAAVTAIREHDALGLLLGTRIYGVVAAQGSQLPRIVFHHITDSPSYDHDSASSEDAGVSESVYQFDCEGVTATQARGIVDSLDELFSGMSKKIGSADIQAAFSEGIFSQQIKHDEDAGTNQGVRMSREIRFLWRDI